MDPVIIGVIALLVVVFLIRMFFGLAKLVFRLIALVVIGVVIWRLMHGH